MKIKSIEIDNKKYDLSNPSTLFYGDSCSGKSEILSAIFSLFFQKELIPKNISGTFQFSSQEYNISYKNEFSGSLNVNKRSSVDKDGKYAYNTVLFYTLDRVNFPSPLNISSSAEKSIFPMYWDISKIDIADSIILIDNIDACLSDNELKSFLNFYLPTCESKSNQIIATSRSEYGMFFKEIRMINESNIIERLQKRISDG